MLPINPQEALPILRWPLRFRNPSYRPHTQESCNLDPDTLQDNPDFESLSPETPGTPKSSVLETRWHLNQAPLRRHGRSTTEALGLPGLEDCRAETVNRVLNSSVWMRGPAPPRAEIESTQCRKRATSGQCRSRSTKGMGFGGSGGFSV